jgi:hypothetical protein
MFSIIMSSNNNMLYTDEDDDNHGNDDDDNNWERSFSSSSLSVLFEPRPFAPGGTYSSLVRSFV